MVKTAGERGIGPRLRRLTWRQRHQKIKKDYRNRSIILAGRALLWQSLKTISANWQLLGGIIVSYGILNFFIASSFVDIHQRFKSLDHQLNSHHFHSALNAFGSLFGSFGANRSAVGVAAEGILFVLVSLMIVWSLRQIFAKKKVSILDSFYSSTSQLVPYLVVLFVLILETLPLALATAIMYAITSPNIEVWGLIIFGVICAGLALATFYLLIAGVLATYIVLLPGMRPLTALRSANDLVKFRRWQILQRILFVTLFIALAMGVIMIPLIVYAHVMVAPTFYALAVLAVLFAHTYLYSLYRSAI